MKGGGVQELTGREKGGGGGSHPRDGRQHLSQQTNNVSSHKNKVAAAAKHFLPE